jgi:hypothetical protein
MRLCFLSQPSTVAMYPRQSPPGTAMSVVFLSTARPQAKSLDSNPMSSNTSSPSATLKAHRKLIRSASETSKARSSSSKGDQSSTVNVAASHQPSARGATRMRPIRVPSISQMSLLRYLIAGRELYAKDLSDLAKVPLGTTYVYIQRLSALGLMERTGTFFPPPHPGIARPYYRITPKGLRVYRLMEELRSALA